jgi:hypothetical protein
LFWNQNPRFLLEPKNRTTLVTSSSILSFDWMLLIGYENSHPCISRGVWITAILNIRILILGGTKKFRFYIPLALMQKLCLVSICNSKLLYKSYLTKIDKTTTFEMHMGLAHKFNCKLLGFPTRASVGSYFSDLN